MNGIIITEESLVATVTAVGVIIAALITAFGGLFVAMLNRARRSADAAQDSARAAVHELKPDSGRSARDALDRIEAWMIRADEKLDADNERLGALEHRVTEHIAQSALIVRSLKKKETP